MSALRTPEHITFEFDEERGEIIARISVVKPLRYSNSAQSITLATTRGGIRVREFLNSAKIPPGTEISINCYKRLSAAQVKKVQRRIEQAAEEEYNQIKQLQAEENVKFGRMASAGGFQPVLKAPFPSIQDRAMAKAKTGGDDLAPRVNRSRPPGPGSIPSVEERAKQAVLSDLSELEADFRGE